MKTLEEFQKTRVFLICVDSDGCAMDTMDIKHIRCFGPCMVEEWNLEQWREPLLRRWNEINLYSMTRGINRFAALAEILEEIHAGYRPVEGAEAFARWACEADELSNDSVRRMTGKAGDEGRIFQKALNWSEAVNERVKHLPEEEKKPFTGAPEGLSASHRTADVAIVSSANLQAVTEEWRRFGMMDCVDACLTQNEGSKAFCIGKMLEKGYEKNRVLMVGDAPGDREAARKNGVLFYPILVGRESESWSRYVSEALPRFLDGTYEGGYQEQWDREFEANLAGGRK